MLFSLEKPDLYCFYDKVKRLAVMSFHNAISAENLQSASDWLESLNSEASPLVGVLCDLRNLRRVKGSKALLDLGKNHPIAFILLHPYQATSINEASNPEQNYLCTQIYQEAFDFLKGSMDEPSSPLVLNSEGATEYYDIEKNIVTVMYYGIVSPIVTADVYTVGGRMIEEYGLMNLRGMVADFRHVIDFDNSNLNAVRRTSGNLNMSYDMSHVAAALVIGTMIQEKMVRMSMKITPQEERKRIVRSLKDAYGFVDEFQAYRLGKASK